MKRTVFVLVCLTILAGLPAIAWADWDPNDPYLFKQMPNLATSGIDINSTSYVPDEGYIVADDFILSTSTKITDFHLWGSWKNDVLPDNLWWLIDPNTGEDLAPPSPDASYMKISVGIYADIPASQNPDHYSKPGTLLWSASFHRASTWEPNEGWFYTRKYADDIQEGFMNPVAPLEYTFPGDTECYQYNCYITEDMAFSAQAGTIYWLGVTVESLDRSMADPQFGWKTSVDQWNDKAVGAQASSDWTWTKITKGGQNYDMAFVVTPEPASLSLLLLGGLSLLRRRKSA